MPTAADALKNAIETAKNRKYALPAQNTITTKSDDGYIRIGDYLADQTFVCFEVKAKNQIEIALTNQSKTGVLSNYSGLFAK